MVGDGDVLTLITCTINACTIRVITKLPNYDQSYKGKVKTHKYINRQNQSTTGKCKTISTYLYTAISWSSDVYFLRYDLFSVYVEQLIIHCLWNRNRFPFWNTWVEPATVWCGSCSSYFQFSLMCFCFVCFRSAYFADVSGLSIFDCPVAFL